MIPLHLYAAFVFATVILMLIPGPNVSVIVANSVSHGTRYGMLALAGTVSATLVQLTLVGFGMAAVMAALAGWFGVIRWAGVAYLIVLASASGARRSRAEPRRRASAQPARDLAARAGGRGDQSQDAAVLRRLFPAIRPPRPPAGAAVRIAVRHLHAGGAVHRQPVGAAGRARAGRPCAARGCATGCRAGR